MFPAVTENPAVTVPRPSSSAAPTANGAPVAVPAAASATATGTATRSRSHREGSPRPATTAIPTPAASQPARGPVRVARPLRAGILLALASALLTGITTAAAVALTSGDGGADEAQMIGAAAAWLLITALCGAFGARARDRRHHGPVLRSTIIALAGTAAVSALGGVPVHRHIVGLLLLLAVVNLLAGIPLRRLVELIAPRRAVLVCPADSARDARSTRHRSVRGFTDVMLQDPEFLVTAIRQELVHDDVDRVELSAGIPESTVHHLSWELREDDVELLLLQPAGPVRPSRIDLLLTPDGPGMLLAPPRPGLLGRVTKRMIDVLGSAALLVVLSPLMLATAVAVRRVDGGPVLFRQERIGLDGRSFEILKFRTMRVGADAQLSALLKEQNRDGQPLFKVAQDPRLTPIGAFLRRSSIDELPQLINVLQGTMSLVGPRPQRPAEVALYTGYDCHRLGVRPGMTGLWQVSGRSRLSWEEARRLDDHYAHEWTPWLDLRILVRTVKVVLLGDGAV